MGGKAFSSGSPGKQPLETPRMSPAVYNHVKAQCISDLKKLGFSRVANPIEAPEKATFGDVDILVCLEGTSFPPVDQFDVSTWDQVGKSLHSERSYYEARIGPDKQRTIDNMSFAIRWPAVFATNPAGQKKDSAAGSGPWHIQVDVSLCDTRQELEWRLFKHNHGDLWNMLGHTIRPFGLTADEIGLHIRIPEIEKEDKKKARVLLTSDPTKVNDFLGLSRPKGEWEKPFKTVNDLFEYAASCRWFMLWPSDKDAEEEETSREDTEDGADKKTRDDSKKLKTKERSRMKQRPVFARWVDEFVPACRARGRSVVSNPKERTMETVRNEVREQAFKAFSGSETAYNAKLADWNKEKTRIYVKNGLIKHGAYLPEDVNPYLPVPRDRDGEQGDDRSARLLVIERQWRSALRSAMEKIIIDDDDSFEGVVPPKLRDAGGVLKVDEVKDWMEENWAEVAKVAWRRQCDLAKEHIEREAAKDIEHTG